MFGYYSISDNYHHENKFRTDLFDKKIAMAGTSKVLTPKGVMTMTNEQVKNPSYGKVDLLNV